MTGGLLQLASYGAEDIYLTGNPEISYFKSVYKRYSNFSMEGINMTFDRIPDFNSNILTANCKIQRAGDLIKNVFLRMKLPSIYNYNYKYNNVDNPLIGLKLILDENGIETEYPIYSSKLQSISNITKINLGGNFTDDEQVGIKLNGYFAMEEQYNILDLYNNIKLDTNIHYYISGITKIYTEENIENVNKYPIKLLTQNSNYDNIYNKFLELQAINTDYTFVNNSIADLQITNNNIQNNINFTQDTKDYVNAVISFVNDVYQFIITNIDNINLYIQQINFIIEQIKYASADLSTLLINLTNTVINLNTLFTTTNFYVNIINNINTDLNNTNDEPTLINLTNDLLITINELNTIDNSSNVNTEIINIYNDINNIINNLVINYTYISLYSALEQLYANNSTLIDNGYSLQKITNNGITYYEIPVLFRARIYNLIKKNGNPLEGTDNNTNINYSYYYIEWSDNYYPLGALLNYIILSDSAVENFPVNFSVNTWTNDADYNSFKFVIPEKDIIYTHNAIKNPYNNSYNYFPNTNYKGSIKNFKWVLNILKNYTLFINGMKIVEQSFDYLKNTLLSTSSFNKNIMINRLIGNIPELINPENSNIGYPTPEYELYIPLHFWFSKDTGMAFPLIAVPNSVVEIRVDFNSIGTQNNTNNNFSGNNFYKGLSYTKPEIKDISLDIEYIFLDETERNFFARYPHEYLIEQVQTNVFTNLVKNSIVKVNFLHPIKEIILYTKNEQENQLYPMNRLYNNQINVNFIKNIKLLFNGNERLQNKPNIYFNTVQPYLYHKGETFPDYLYYSFSIDPENIEPRGSCNFSKINNFLLEIEFDEKYLNKTFKYNEITGLPNKIITINNDMTLTENYEYTPIETKLYITGINYNILVIKSGLAGVKFAT